MKEFGSGVVSGSYLIQQLKWRYAVKKFDAHRKIAPELWGALEESLVLSPSSFGLQPWKFFVVGNPETRKKLQPFAWNQSQIVDASHLVVFAVKKNIGVEDVRKFIAYTAKVRGVAAESMAAYQTLMEGFVARPPMDINVWAARQVYIALGNFLTSAAVLGVDACPMEGIDPGRFDEVLGLAAKGYATTVVATAGFRAEDDAYARAAKVRYPRADVVELLTK